MQSSYVKPQKKRRWDDDEGFNYGESKDHGKNKKKHKDYSEKRKQKRGEE